MRITALCIVLGMGLIAGSAATSAGGGGEDGDFEVGLFAGLAYPDDYDTLDPDGATLYGVRFGWFWTQRWSVEGSWQTIPTDGSGSGSPDVDLNALRGNLLWNFRADEKFRWFLTVGLGSESVEADDAGVDESAVGWNAGGGARWYLGRSKNFGLRADVRWVAVDVGGPVDGTQNNYEVNGGVLYSFGGGTPPDSDGDRVPDKKDKCAGTPKGARVDSTGCPLDADGDRVADGIDKCAGTPAGTKVDSTGCPADTDSDGIADMVDRCPGTTAGAKVDETGCPTEDADGDSVWDGADRCPNTPQGAKVDPVGCPTDTDGDGVADGIDKCDGTPRGTPVDVTGCPQPANQP